LLTDWLKKGASLRRIPDLSGAWAPVVSHICRIQRRNQKRKIKTRSLLGRFEKVSLAMPDGTLILRANNEIDWANKIAEQLLGVRFPEDGGQRIDNLVRSPEFVRYLNQADYSDALNIPSPISDDIELSIQIIPFGHGDRLLTARDISTFTQVQAMRRDFVANVSHELRTPLTVITGYLEALVDERKSDQELYTVLRSVQGQSNRMQQIVDDLLELARLEGRSGDMDDDVHVPGILSELLTEAMHMAHLSGHHVFGEIDENLSLRGGYKEICSLATNLVHNALRHTPIDSKIWIKWSVDPVHQTPVFAVSDNGPGIDQEHIARLTERFYRVDTGRTRQVGGTGLGLSIVKHIMLRHGGRLQIQSQPGKGAEFICIFPVNRSVINPRPKRIKI
jgi:two-component system phosphate regulon sensor histidine kinase PhoR